MDLSRILAYLCLIDGPSSFFLLVYLQNKHDPDPHPWVFVVLTTIVLTAAASGFAIALNLVL